MPPEELRRRRTRIDLLLGIPLGLVLGVGVVAAFVFLGGDSTIDAPSLSTRGDGGSKGAAGTVRRGEDRIPVVRIIGGLPPGREGGARIEGRPGAAVRFRADTDQPLTLDVLDTRSGSPVTILSKSVADGQVVRFSFDRAGQYALVAAGNDVNLATFVIRRGP